MKNEVNVKHISNEIPLEGLGHGFVVAPGEFPHEILVKIVADSIDSIDSSS